jgi:hypothetical protein
VACSKAGRATLKLGELIICFKELFQKESGDSLIPCSLHFCEF